VDFAQLPASFVALDVEIASRTPLQICAIGVVRLEQDLETDSFSSCVRSVGPVRYGHVHGLTAADVANAPPWTRVWADVRRVIGSLDTVVAFRAAFDRGALLTMCGRHGVVLPRLRFVCAAEMMKARFGCQLSLVEALRRLDLPFPGRPHDPLADARAAAIVALTCARDSQARG
jgi:DNA polymerase-3 subunit epsilon